MTYYVIMNDYASSVMPKYLHAIVDVKKQVNEDWEYEGSEYSFPYYLTDASCPDGLFLLCNKSIGSLKFDYYNHSRAHIFSDVFKNLIYNKRSIHYISKKLSAISIKDGSVLRNDLNYVYFPCGNELLDLNLSELEEDRFGDLIPHKLVFSPLASNYDVFSIRKSLLGGYIFVSDNLASEIKSKKSRE